MFRFSIREMMLVTLVFALGLGWWVEHGGKSKTVQEAGYEERKHLVLEVSLLGKGYTVKTEVKSITLTGAGETAIYTPTSLDYRDDKGTVAKMSFSNSKLP